MSVNWIHTAVVDYLMKLANRESDKMEKLSIIKLKLFVKK